MLDRRDFTGLLAAAAALPAAAAQAADSVIPFYSAVGPTLTVWGFNTGTGALTPRDTMKFSCDIQYAWPDSKRRFYYFVSTTGQPGFPMGNGSPGTVHYLTAFRIDPATGKLTPHGEPALLKSRPLNVSVDHEDRFILVAYNNPPAHVTVHRIAADGTVGAEVEQDPNLDFGFFCHQVRPTPNNKTVIAVTRGNNPRPGKPEDPGAIKVFGFSDGKLTPIASLAPAGRKGYGFGPRHLDFHPTLPFVYVSLERESRLDVYRLNEDGTLSDQAVFQKQMLTNPEDAKIPGQSGGPIHVHPNGRFVYVTNRGDDTVDFNGQKVSNGGINNVAVFTIDQKTGEPTLIQQAPAHSFELHTFAMDPATRLLIATSQQPGLLREGETVRELKAGFTIYRVGKDGKLGFLRKHDLDLPEHGLQFWSGLLNMP